MRLGVWCRRWSEYLVHSASQVLCETLTHGSVRAGRAGSVQVTGACRQLLAVRPLMTEGIEKAMLKISSEYYLAKILVHMKDREGDITCNQSSSISAGPCISQRMGCPSWGYSTRPQFQGHHLDHRDNTYILIRDMFDNFVMLSISLTWHQYSRAKMSCCFVSADPLVGKKFSSSNDTCKTNVWYNSL